MAQDYKHKQDGSRSVSLNELTKDELVSEVLRLRGQLKKKDSFGLVFERQKEDAILNRAKTIPILKENQSKHVNNGGEDNLLLIGDNFDSLTCLLETHKGKIDVIYIDPPYNTGNEDFIYNDKYVNPEDSFRHSKWLSFMENRLLLSKELLSDNGVVFVSIDDNEQAQLKMLMDYVFGGGNFIANMIWRSKGSGAYDSSNLVTEHEYLLVYSKNVNFVSFNKSKFDTSSDAQYKYADEKESFAGKYKRQALAMGSLRYSKTGDYEIECPDGTKILPGGKYGPPHTWRYNEETFKKQKAANNVEFVLTKNGWSIYSKQYEFIDGQGLPIERSAPYRSVIDNFLNRQGSEEIKNILPSGYFSYPKPSSLIKFIINLINYKDATILDFFAGSGTTGQSVLELNKEDGGNRKFILCTNDEAGIGKTVTYERIKRVITGKNWADGKEHVSHAASIRYFNVSFIERDKIAKELSDKVDSLINIASNCFEEVAFEDMFKVWKNDNGHYAALIKDSWGIESFIESLGKAEPSTISVYVNDNGADYRIELADLQIAGWDVDYISLDDFVLDVIAFVDEKVGVSVGEDGSNGIENKLNHESVYYDKIETGEND